MPKRKKSMTMGGAVSLTVTLLVLLVAFPFSAEVRFTLAIFLALGWLVTACRWLIFRYGQRAGMLVGVVLLSLGAWVGIQYLLDEPNRRLVARIKELPGCSAFTNGRVFTGEVSDVYISSQASDKEVWRFTRLDGLDQLTKIFVDGVRLRDETARQFGRFTTLRSLLLRGTGVSDEVLDELQEKLPNCHLWVE